MAEEFSPAQTFKDQGQIKMNETTKYGLFFVGGVIVGALGAVALTRGKLDVKPLATNLLSSGMDLRDKIMAGVEGVKEDLADVVAEAEVKAQEKEIKRLNELNEFLAEASAFFAASHRKSQNK